MAFIMKEGFCVDNGMFIVHEQWRLKLSSADMRSLIHCTPFDQTFILNFNKHVKILLSYT